ncbi:sulfur oxidation c-type cytochrome SoxA [Pseudaestuariivita atlantica]|uniref:SoxAX cytochrome complex subunit A n=1 Tax=Pseudaestuariivita atlantica TaxID=1317121 RepID=A0A0L1JN34_9RHOB|nr:sulfur oxidation c-type cytochrome SoxA [Pseudaestuariivita atlantica]KNG92818.1 cytochrome C [Pseudaestuariivita atlantica]
MRTTFSIATALILAAGTGLAQDSNSLSIEGEPMVTEVAAPAHMENVDTIYSGWRFRSQETQALETDDFENPAMVFVDKGIDLFDKVEGSEGKACSSCHEDVADFAGLRTTLPRVEDGELVTMENLVNECRTERMGAEPWKWSGGQMTAVTALIGLQSRGMPVNVAIDGEAAPFWEKGKELYYTKVGQLQMACSNCHEDNYGVMIRADHLSQGQINGFPTYRLKNAKLNSAHGRFKGCMKNIRATPYKEGGEEFLALELYLASRGQGLSVETPSVRN